MMIGCIFNSDHHLFAYVIAKPNKETTRNIIIDKRMLNQAKKYLLLFSW